MKLKQRAEAAERLQGSAREHDRSGSDQGHILSTDPIEELVADRTSESRATLTRHQSYAHRRSNLPAPLVDEANPAPVSGSIRGSSAMQSSIDPNQNGLSQSLTTERRPLSARPEHHGASASPISPHNSTAFVEPNPDDFYGGSSTLSFMHAVQTTIISKSSPDMATPDSGHRTSQTTRIRRKPESLRLGVENCLPQRALADDLVGCYFRNVHTLYPFLHRPTFEAQYERTWTSGEQQDDEWLSMLNVIFALGIHFAYGREDKSAASDRFFGYAQKLTSMEQFAQASLQTLQLLLLSGLYYQSTSRPNQSWNVIGLAIRIATTIGVHVDPVREHYDPIQIELRRRCWYGCFVLDSYVSLISMRGVLADLSQSSSC